jgi:small subunit ribosomal protein S1
MSGTDWRGAAVAIYAFWKNGFSPGGFDPTFDRVVSTTQNGDVAAVIASSAQPADGDEAGGKETRPEAEQEPEAPADSPAAPAASPADAGSDSAGVDPVLDADLGQKKAAPESPKPKRRRRRKNAPNGEGHDKPPHPRRASDRAPFHVGEEVFGKVTAVLDTAIMLDLSGKALGIFDRSEMEPDDLVPAVGDRFVAHVHNDGSRGGLVVLTRKPLREEDTRPMVEQAKKDGGVVCGLVTGVIKGGVEVDIGGLRAFAPASGMDLHPSNANFTALLGKQLDFKVLEYQKSGRDIVVTRRPMLEAVAREKHKQALGLLEEGQVVRALVRTVVEWGVFVALPDAENLEGLVHASEASHDSHDKLIELFKPGDQLELKIAKIDEKGKIWLSRKALIEDPWAQAKQKYAPGTRHSGKVTRLEEFGAFIEVDSGIEGLIHISDLTLTHIEHPKDVLSVGQEVEVVVHHFDLRTKRLGLHPAPKPEHAGEAPQKIARNATVKAQVIKGETGGVLVRLLGVTGRAARGYIPAGQTGTPRGADLRKTFKPGTVLDLKVMEVDPRRGEAKLSIRSLKQDEERRAHKEYRQKLKAEASFGTLGDLLKRKLDLSSKSNGRE